MNTLSNEPDELGTVIMGVFRSETVVFVNDGHPCHPWYNTACGNANWSDIHDPVLLGKGVPTSKYDVEKFRAYNSEFRGAAQ